MCGNLFGGSSPSYEAPKVEKVAPAPQTITPTESNAANDRAAAEKKKLQQRRGYLETRRVTSTDSLMNQAQSGKRSTLG